MPAIQDLRERVGALALSTNGPGDTQQHKIDVTGLAAHFDAIVISGEASHQPTAPSTSSRMRSAWPLCRAYSSIMCT